QRCFFPCHRYLLPLLRYPYLYHHDTYISTPLSARLEPLGRNPPLKIGRTEPQVAANFAHKGQLSDVVVDPWFGDVENFADLAHGQKSVVLGTLELGSDLLAHNLANLLEEWVKLAHELLPSIFFHPFTLLAWPKDQH